LEYRIKRLPREKKLKAIKDGYWSTEGHKHW
jgi:hypothetical protein